MELAMLRLLNRHMIGAAGTRQLLPLRGACKTLYLGPIKALVQEREADWQQRYGSALGLQCLQLTGVSRAADGCKTAG
jgi:superfamily II helicase